MSNNTKCCNTKGCNWDVITVNGIEFALKAANMHYELVEALEHLLFEPFDLEPDNRTEKEKEMLMNFYELLAKARQL